MQENFSLNAPFHVSTNEKLKKSHIQPKIKSTKEQKNNDCAYIKH